jgi:hypothetical protein
MLSDPSRPASMIFPLVMGCLMLLLALFTVPLQRLLRIRRGSEVFTVPKFQRTARVNETLGRLSTGILGIVFILSGVGGSLLPFDALYTVLFSLLGLMGLLVLAMGGVILANWKA